MIHNIIFMSQLRHHFLCKAFSDSLPSPRLGCCLSSVLVRHFGFSHYSIYCARWKHGLTTCLIAQQTVNSRKAGPSPFLSLLYCQWLAHNGCSIKSNWMSGNSLTHSFSFILSASKPTCLSAMFISMPCVLESTGMCEKWRSTNGRWVG